MPAEVVVTVAVTVVAAVVVGVGGMAAMVVGRVLVVGVGVAVGLAAVGVVVVGQAAAMVAAALAVGRMVDLAAVNLEAGERALADLAGNNVAVAVAAAEGTQSPQDFHVRH